MHVLLYHTCIGHYVGSDDYCQTNEFASFAQMYLKDSVDIEISTFFWSLGDEAVDHKWTFNEKTTP